MTGFALAIVDLNNVYGTYSTFKGPGLCNCGFLHGPTGTCFFYHRVTSIHVQFAQR